ncbi:MAG: O-antigen ligase family protein [Guyparkeria sp.]
MPKRLLRGPEASQSWALLLALALPFLLTFKRGLADTTLGLFVLVGLAIAFKRREAAWFRQPWLYAAFALSAVLVLLSPFSLNPGESAVDAFLALRWPLFAALLAWFLLADPRRLRLFEGAVAVLVGFLLFDGMWQYVLGHDLFGVPRHSAARLTGPFDSPLIGSFTDRLWFVALAGVWAWGLYRHGVVAIGSALVLSALGALFVLLTGERSAFLLFLLGTAIVFVGVFLRLPRWRLPLVAMGGIAVALVVALAVSQPKMVERTVSSTAQAIATPTENVYGQNFIAAWQAFEQQPFTGVGARQFQAYCQTTPEVRESYEQLGFPECVAHLHNHYSGMLAEGGLFAFLAFVAMVALLVREAFRRDARGGSPGQLRAYFAIALLMVTFWPIQVSMEYFNGWAGALSWMGVGWALARAGRPFGCEVANENLCRSV